MPCTTWTLGLLLLVFLPLNADDRSSNQTADLSLTAVGRHHHPIQTKNREAQDYFDQGITLIYGFNHEEAARSFQRAAELEPASPMPLWGVALAVGPNYNMEVDPEHEKLAWDTIRRAQKLAVEAPQIEKDYVAALAARYSGEKNPVYSQLAQNYAAAMKVLSRKYPDDLDAATLYAESLMDLSPWNLWSNDGKPGANTLEIVAVLEGVLARDPLHPGANHYYIHAVEASPNPEHALPSARRLETMVPTAGHLVHMSGHIYERTGDFDHAAASNVEAIKADEAYAMATNQQGSMYDLMYRSHNEHFLTMAACMQGNYAKAKATVQNMDARLLPHAKTMPMLDVFLMSSYWVEARFGRWQEILARPEPMKELPGTHATWRYSRAIALASTGKLSDAQKERDLLVTEVAAMPPEAMIGPRNKASDAMRVGIAVAEARIAAAKGEKEKAIERWQEAVKLQDSLAYNEPADWFYPVRESLGAALLSAGKAAEAEQVFRQDLRENPRNPRSLFGLQETLKSQGKSADSAWVAGQFEKAWKDADSKLSLDAL
jgi:tetratricopeptide (TPR) repeat protein